MLARFGNGLLYRFIRGQVATPDNLTEAPVWRGVARQLAQWHAALPAHDISSNAIAPENADDGNCLDRADSHIKATSGTAVGFHDIKPIKPRKEGPNLWTVMQKWILASPASTEQERSRRVLLQKEFERIVAEFDDGSGLGEEGVTQHNPSH